MPLSIFTNSFASSSESLTPFSITYSKVMAQMRATPINDFFAKGGKIRIDGRMVHDMYLFEVKKPEESKKPWDYYKQLAVVPGDKAFATAAESGCPLTK